MSAIAPILEELAREADATRRLLQRLPADQLSWRPHPKSRTLGELAWHVATIPGRIAAIAQREDVDVLTVKAPPMPDAAAGIQAGFEQSLAEARTLLAKLDDVALAGAVTMRRGAVKMFTRTKLDLLRTVLLNHGYHHRGQLTVYLRLLDVPLPPVYGPTADES